MTQMNKLVTPLKQLQQTVAMSWALDNNNNNLFSINIKTDKLITSIVRTQVIARSQVITVLSQTKLYFSHAKCSSHPTSNLANTTI